MNFIILDSGCFSQKSRIQDSNDELKTRLFCFQAQTGVWVERGLAYSSTKENVLDDDGGWRQMGCQLSACQPYRSWMLDGVYLIEKWASLSKTPEGARPLKPFIANDEALTPWELGNLCSCSHCHNDKEQMVPHHQCFLPGSSTECLHNCRPPTTVKHKMGCLEKCS